jgi:DNA N-6-adenine-methyltransferase Dam
MSAPATKAIARRQNQYQGKVRTWHVPDEFFNVLDREFDFAETSLFLEPPNSAKTIELQLRQAYDLARTGKTVVAFLPCSTDQRWWHKCAMLASEIIWIEGRVRLVDQSGQLGSSPVGPSVILVYRPGETPAFPRMRSLRKVDGDYYLPKKHG